MNPIEITVNLVMCALLFVWLIMALIKVFIEDLNMKCDSNKELPRRDTRTGELNE